MAEPKSFSDFLSQKGWKDYPGKVSGTNDWKPAEAPDWSSPAKNYMDPNNYGDYFDARPVSFNTAYDPDTKDAGPGFAHMNDPPKKFGKGIPPHPGGALLSDDEGTDAPKPKHLPKPRGILPEVFQGADSMDDGAFMKALMEKVGRHPISLVSDLHGDKFSPSPQEAIDYVVTLCQNPRMIERFVRELKRRELLPELVRELSAHPEMHHELAGLMGDEDGPAVAHRFAKALYDHHRGNLTKVGMAEAVADEVWSGAHETDGAGDAMTGPDFAGDFAPPGGEGGEEAQQGDDTEQPEGQDEQPGDQGGDLPPDDQGGDLGGEAGDQSGDLSPVPPVDAPPAAHHHLLKHLKQYFPDALAHHASSEV